MESASGGGGAEPVDCGGEELQRHVIDEIIAIMEVPPVPPRGGEPAYLDIEGLPPSILSACMRVTPELIVQASRVATPSISGDQVIYPGSTAWAILR